MSQLDSPKDREKMSDESSGDAGFLTSSGDVPPTRGTESNVAYDTLNDYKEDMPAQPITMDNNTDESSEKGVDNPGFEGEELKNGLNGKHVSPPNEHNTSVGSFLNSSSVQNKSNANSNNASSPDMAEAVNLELIHMKPFGNGINGIPVKKGDAAEVDMGDPYDEYFVPVNEHKKYIRGEKLYVTKDKRNPSTKCKLCCWRIGLVILVIAVIVGILTAFGLVSLPDQKEPIESRNFQWPNNSPSLAKTGMSKSREKVETSSYTPPPPSMPPFRVPTTDTSALYVPKVIEGELTIDNLQFSQDLVDHNSPEYKELAKTLEDEIKRAVFDKQTLNYGSADIYVKVMDMRSGSIVVKYRLGWIFKQGINKPPDPITTDALIHRLQTHLRDQNGYIYNFKVPTHSLRGHRLEDSCQIDNHGCSHYCNFNYIELNFVCSCPDHFKLSADNKACVEDSLVNQTPHPEPKPEPEPEPEPKLEHEPSEPKSEPEPEPKPEPEPAPEPTAEPAPKIENEPTVQPEPSSKKEHETVHEPSAEPVPSLEPVPSAEPVPDSSVEGEMKHNENDTDTSPPLISVTNIPDLEGPFAVDSEVSSDALTEKTKESIMVHSTTQGHHNNSEHHDVDSATHHVHEDHQEAHRDSTENHHDHEHNVNDHPSDSHHEHESSDQFNEEKESKLGHDYSDVYDLRLNEDDQDYNMNDDTDDSHVFYHEESDYSHNEHMRNSTNDHDDNHHHMFPQIEQGDSNETKHDTNEHVHNIINQPSLIDDDEDKNENSTQKNTDKLLTTTVKDNSVVENHADVENKVTTVKNPIPDELTTSSVTTSISAVDDSSRKSSEEVEFLNVHDLTTSSDPIRSMTVSSESNESFTKQTPVLPEEMSTKINEDSIKTTTSESVRNSFSPHNEDSELVNSLHEDGGITKGKNESSVDSKVETGDSSSTTDVVQPVLMVTTTPSFKESSTDHHSGDTEQDPLVFSDNDGRSFYNVDGTPVVNISIDEVPKQKPYVPEGQSDHVLNFVSVTQQNDDSSTTDSNQLGKHLHSDTESEFAHAVPHSEINDIEKATESIGVHSLSTNIPNESTEVSSTKQPSTHEEGVKTSDNINLTDGNLKDNLPEVSASERTVTEDTPKKNGEVSPVLITTTAATSVKITTVGSVKNLVLSNEPFITESPLFPKAEDEKVIMEMMKETPRKIDNVDVLNSPVLSDSAFTTEHPLFKTGNPESTSKINEVNSSVDGGVSQQKDVAGNVIVNPTTENNLNKTKSELSDEPPLASRTDDEKSSVEIVTENLVSSKPTSKVEPNSDEMKDSDAKEQKTEATNVVDPEVGISNKIASNEGKVENITNTNAEDNELPNSGNYTKVSNEDGKTYSRIGIFFDKLKKFGTHDQNSNESASESVTEDNGVLQLHYLLVHSSLHPRLI